MRKDNQYRNLITMAWKQWDKTSFPYICDVAKYKIIIRKIEEYLSIPYYDKKDLSYFIKELFENGQLYISADAVTKEASTIFKTNQLKNISGDDFRNPAIMNTSHIRYPNVQNAHWEHVVPTSMIIDCVLRLYMNKAFTLSAYQKIRNVCGMVCIVTTEENKKLKRDKMPNGMIVDNLFTNTEFDPWSRYNEVGIKIY